MSTWTTCLVFLRTARKWELCSGRLGGAGFSVPVFALLLCACTPAGPPGKGKGLAALLEEADRLARAGQPRGAADLLEEARGSGSLRASAVLGGKIAEYYLVCGSNQGALRLCDELLSAGPGNPDLLYVKGEAQRRLVNLAAAREVLSEALRLSPGHPRASLAMARLKFRTAAPVDALPLFEAFFAGKAENEAEELISTARLEYGRALRAAGRHQEAADEFAVLLEGEPTRSEYYSELSGALYRLRYRKEAKFLESIYKVFSQGSFEEYGVAKMRLQGREAQALAQQAANRQRQRRFLAAFESHRNALAANSGDARIPGLYARYCLGFRRFDEGVEVISSAIAAGCRPLSGLWWERGRLEVGRRDWQAAAGAFRSTIAAIETEHSQGDRGGSERGQANGFSAYLGLARSLIELGRGDSADEAISQAGRFSPSAWEPSYWRGRNLLAAGEAPAALRAFEEAARLGRIKGLEPTADLVAWTVVARARAGAGGALEELVAQLEKAPGRLELYPEVLALCGEDPARREWARKGLEEMTANRAKLDVLEAELQGRSLEESAGIYTELAAAYSKFKEPGAYEYLFLASELDPMNAALLKRLLNIRSRPQDVFFRLRLLRRLLAAEPLNESAPWGMAEIFLKLHVRLAEARALVEDGLGKHPGSTRLESLRARLGE